MQSPNTSRVWALPNGRTLGLAAVLMAMCYAGASQGNGAAYLLCFILAGLGIVSTVHAWVNLRGLAVSAESVRPVFAREQIAVPLAITAPGGRRHFAVRIAAEKGSP